MNFDRFLDHCRFQWPGFDNPETLAKLAYPVVRSHSAILSKVVGMATENKLKLLSLAVANLDDDEVYVEIGTWRGASLAGAAVGNPTARIFACDNFSQFEGTQAILEQTIHRYAAPGQVSFFNMDFRRFLKLAPWKPSRVGAYFYDGGHRFLEQYDALALMLPHLTKDAVVIVDDTNGTEVRVANSCFVRRVPEFQVVADIRTADNGDLTWWNGIQILRYRGGLRTHPAPMVAGLAVAWYGAYYESRWFAASIPSLRRSVRWIRSRVRERK